MNKNKIPFSQFGKIMKGDNCGWYIRIEDDTEVTGGYYLFLHKSNTDSEVYDYWFENLIDLKNHIKHSYYSIDWKI